MPHALKMLTVALFAAALVAPAGAMASDGTGTGEPTTVTASFEVVGVSPQTRIAKVVLECVGSSYNGKGVAVQVAPGVEMSSFAVGAHLTGTVDRSTDPPTVVAVQASTCGDAKNPPRPADPVPTGQPGKGDGSGSGDNGSSDQGSGDDSGAGDTGAGDDQSTAPKFRPSFLNRVWRFEGSADSYDAGVLGMTIESVKGLPKRLRNQDDSLIDQDALVLVGSKTRIYGVDGKRTTEDALVDADRVGVTAKLLPPAKWQDDQDGQATPTLRAKRVYILK